MGFRSRALLTGAATGFLKANNDRSARMQERMQELADNNATMSRERAKSRYEATSAQANAIASTKADLLANNFIDADGNYTKQYYKNEAYLQWKDPNVQKAFGGPKGYAGFEEKYISRNQIPRFVDPYKPAAQREADLTKLYSSIDAKQQVEANQPTLTGLDKFLMKSASSAINTVGDGVREVTNGAIDIQSGADPTAPKPVPELAEASPLRAQEPMGTQAPVEPMLDWDTPVAPASPIKSTSIEDDFKTGKRKAVIIQENGIVIEKSLDIYLEDKAQVLNVPKDNKADFKENYATITDTISATGKINQSLNVYSEKSQGLQGFVVDAVSGIAALTTIWQGSGSATSDKVQVQEAYNVIREATDITAEQKQFLLDPANKNAILEQGKAMESQEKEKLIARIQLTMAEDVLEEDFEHLASAIRNSTIDTLAVSAAWDMARANRQGDGSKISLKEVDSYIKLLGSSSNEQDFVTKINVLKEDLVKKSLNSIHAMFRSTRFGGTESTFSAVNGTTSHMLDPLSGDVALVQRGTVREKGVSRNVMYVITGRDSTILEINLDDNTQTQDDLIKLDQWSKMSVLYTEPVTRAGRPKR